jgi:uncharacterized protein (DUF1778 family)
MPKPSEKEAMSRLEAGIPTSVYAGEDARRVIEETEILRMARADQIAFARALIDPPAPNEKLVGARRRHAALIEKR